MLANTLADRIQDVFYHSVNLFLCFLSNYSLCSTPLRRLFSFMRQNDLKCKLNFFEYSTFCKLYVKLLHKYIEFDNFLLTLIYVCYIIAINYNLINNVDFGYELTRRFLALFGEYIALCS